MLWVLWKQDECHQIWITVFGWDKFIFYKIHHSELNILHRSYVDLNLCNLGGQLCAVCM